MWSVDERNVVVVVVGETKKLFSGKLYIDLRSFRHLSGDCKEVLQIVVNLS